MNIGNVEIDSISRRIAATVIYFDTIEIAPTIFEVWRYLIGGVPASYAQVHELIANDNYLKTRISLIDGFCVLKESAGLADERKKRYCTSDILYKKVKRGLRWISLYPGVTSISVCNTAAMNNARVGSDFDAAILCREGSIWSARLWAIFVTLIFGLRINKSTTAGKLCLSFFVDSSAYDLRAYSAGDRDYHFAYWIKSMLPLYNDKELERFEKANAWTDQLLGQAGARMAGSRRRIGSSPLRTLFALLGKIFGFMNPLLNKIAKFIETRSFSKKKLELAGLGEGNVVINDHLLKFHELDRRRLYNSGFEQACLKYLN